MDIDSFKLEQYKQLLAHIASLQTSRETSNNFWIVINTVGLYAVGYMKDTSINNGIKVEATALILFFLAIFLGILWLITLLTFKKNLDGFYSQILMFEKEYKSITFAKAYEKKIGNFLISLSEVFVPICFVISYILLGIIWFYRA